MNAEKALNYLKKDENRYACYLECVKRDNVEFLYCENDGLFFFNKDAGIYFLVTNDESACKKAVSNLENINFTLMCCNEYEYRVVKEKFNLNGLNSCKQIVWEGDYPLAVKGICQVKKLEATEENVNKVYEHYTLHFDKEHIKKIIEELGVYGGFVDGEMVGFIGRHEEHSIGMLEVFPEYRRRGYAEEIEKSVVNVLLKNGERVFAHIIDSNVASLKMHEKMGYTFSQGTFYWMFKKD